MYELRCRLHEFRVSRDRNWHYMRSVTFTVHDRWSRLGNILYENTFGGINITINKKPSYKSINCMKEDFFARTFKFKYKTDEAALREWEVQTYVSNRDDSSGNGNCVTNSIVFPTQKIPNAPIEGFTLKRSIRDAISLKLYLTVCEVIAQKTNQLPTQIASSRTIFGRHIILSL